jgi:hypothetical protein
MLSVRPRPDIRGRFWVSHVTGGLVGGVADNHTIDHDDWQCIQPDVGFIAAGLFQSIIQWRENIAFDYRLPKGYLAELVVRAFEVVVDDYEFVRAGFLRVLELEERGLEPLLNGLRRVGPAAGETLA